MSEDEIIRCEICGEPATHSFGNNGTLPVCDNVACQQAILDEVNTILQLARELGEE